jgi:hypothetical protein
LLRGSIGDRIKAFNGKVHHSPEATIDFGGRIAGFDVFAQHDAASKRRRADGIVRLNPVSFIAISGALSYDAPDNEPKTSEVVPALSGAIIDSLLPKSTSARIEVGVRLFNPWLIGGFVTRDTAVLAAPTVVDSAYTIQTVGKRQGLYLGLRGRLYKDINVEVVGTRWDSAGYYQPRYQARSELNLTTRWLSRFPSGSFGLKLAAIHEYRDVVRFPTANGFRSTAASSVTSAQVEIRILRGVASYQVRNMFGKAYQIFPDFYMHRSVGIYGIRWEFWN